MADDTKAPGIECSHNGPLLVYNLQTLKDPEGNEIEIRKSTVALCRCGGSSNKPFCDGTHNRNGFSSERASDVRHDKQTDYEGHSVTVHDNRAACAHAAYCVHTLPSVFDVNGRPWIQPQNATAEEVIATVRKCPSGALSYSQDGEKHQDWNGPQEIQFDTGGPYNVRGGIPLVAENLTWAQEVSKEHYSLCRCGQSHTKPFCDGRHRNHQFDSL